MIRNLRKMTKYSVGLVMPKWLITLWGCKRVHLDINADRIIITPVDEEGMK